MTAKHIAKEFGALFMETGNPLTKASYFDNVTDLCCFRTEKVAKYF